MAPDLDEMLTFISYRAPFKSVSPTMHLHHVGETISFLPYSQLLPYRNRATNRDGIIFVDSLNTHAIALRYSVNGISWPNRVECVFQHPGRLFSFLFQKNDITGS